MGAVRTIFRLTREIYLPGHATSVFEVINKNSLADEYDFDGCVGTRVYLRTAMACAGKGRCSYKNKIIFFPEPTPRCKMR